MTTLFVNACVRGEVSRTLELCREYLSDVEDVVEVNLAELRPEPYYAEQVAYRSQLQKANMFDDPIFDLAKQFAEADEVVIGAPYWDLSFPSVLKVYIEHTTVDGITFRFTPEATFEGLCKAKSLVLISSCGGVVAGQNFGFEYLCGIARMYGIDNAYQIAVENVDMVGADVDALLDKARGRVRELKASLHGNQA